MTCPSFDQSDPHHRPRAERGASRLQGRLLILAMSLFAAGCDTFTFNPPRPPELTKKAATPRTSTGISATSSSAKVIEVVLMPRIESDVETLRTSAKLQAGMDTTRVQVTAPPEGAPASEQAELVRKAIARKPPVIVIEVPNAPDATLIAAAAEAQKAGVTVVTIGRRLTGSQAPASESASAAGPPMILVAHEELKPSAATLVADAMRAAKNGKIATDAGAVILVDPTVDALFQDRVNALRDVLKAAGVKKIEELPFAKTIKDGETKLVEYLKAHPETTLVFAVDAGGMLAADDATGVLKTDHRFVIAGYSSNEAARSQVMMGEYAALGVFGVDRLFRRAVNVAAGILKGSKIPERVEIEIPILESSETAGPPRMKVLPPDKPMMLQKGGASTEN
ncbi:MAG: substrate-binding domain-containing protein [Paludisphaera borealis]|uniref:sugar ABC transporter substrate-binding protein n=1 Tax=Paludisphaera borealis TaxID=1387353 RepID=UPI00283DA9AD|nr:substrate-binding domain-containing protein [Paludisphaera borealis]MDR3619849.1 substrate-binding domain-containing protein [Paludisphaera borealis]